MESVHPAGIPDNASPCAQHLPLFDRGNDDLVFRFVNLIVVG